MENVNSNEVALDQIEMHSEAEEAALLNSLNDEDFEPVDAEQNNTNNTALLVQGAATVVTVLGVGEQLIKQFGHQDFAFDIAQVDNVAKAAAPLFVKYGGELPPWLAQYKEEIVFTFAAGALGLGSYSQIKALKKIDKEKEVKETKPEDEIKPVEQVA